MTEQVADMGIVVQKAGGPEVLEWTRVDTAAPGAGEVRVVQKAIGDPLAKMLLSGEVQDGDTVPVNVSPDGDSLVLE